MNFKRWLKFFSLYFHLFIPKRNIEAFRQLFLFKMKIMIVCLYLVLGVKPIYLFAFFKMTVEKQGLSNPISRFLTLKWAI